MAQNDFNQKITEIVQLQFESEPVDSMACRALTIVGQTLKVQRTSFWRLNQAQSQIFCEYLVDLEKGLISDVESLSEADFPQYFSGIKTGVVVSADDAITDPFTQEFAKSYLAPRGISSMLDVPVFCDNALKGVICCEHIGNKRAWRRDEKEFAARVASILGDMLAK